MPTLRNDDTQRDSLSIFPSEVIKNTAHANLLMSHRKSVSVCAFAYYRLVVKEVHVKINKWPSHKISTEALCNTLLI